MMSGFTLRPHLHIANLRIVPLVAIAVLLGAAAPVSDTLRGETIVTHGTSGGALPCMACHGPNLAGNSSIGAPPLAGVPAISTLRALDAIASGSMGQNYVMKHIAKSLTTGQRQAVADYLASLKLVSP
jgi:cytochrome c553